MENLKTLYVDGYTLQSNPSPFGGGYVVLSPEGKVVSTNQFNKDNYTNNEAELYGAVVALGLIEPKGTIYTDSKIICQWIGNRRSKARPDLNHLIVLGGILLRDKEIKLTLVPREANKAGIYIEKTKI